MATIDEEIDHHQPRVRDYINAVQAQCAEIVQRSTVCFFDDIDGVPIPYGSGVLFQIADARLIFTAAHGFRVASKLDLMVMNGSTPAEFVALSGASVAKPEGSTADDPFDIAVVRLTREAGDQLALSKTFLRLSSIDIPHRSARGSYYYLQGFPTASAFPDLDARQLVAHFLRVGGTARSPQASTFDPALYIDLGVPGDGMIDDKGNAVVIEDVDGMSGCGLWRLFTAGDITDGQPWNPDKLKYVGVQHEWKKQEEYARATRAEHILALVCSSWTDLAAAVSVSVSATWPALTRVVKFDI